MCRHRLYGPFLPVSVSVDVCSFVNHCLSGEPDFDLLLIVESVPFGLQAQNLTRDQGFSLDSFNI